jgi:hypothetical protein
MLKGLNTALARARAILFSPKTEWAVIAERPETVVGLYKDYLLFLAAIPVIVSFVRGTIIGVTTSSGAIDRVGVIAGLGGIVVQYVLWLGLIYVLGLIVNALAPTFGGQKNQVQALKTVAYAFTGVAFGSIGEIIPRIGLLIVVAGILYTLYLFYVGLPIMMKAPAGKALRYAGLIGLASVALGFAVVNASSLGISMRAAGQSTSFSENSPGQRNKLVIENNGTHAITELYAVATSSHSLLGETYWEASVLGDNIEPGSRRTMNTGPYDDVTQCKTDMKFVYADGFVKIIREIDLCNTHDVSVDY